MGSNKWNLCMSPQTAIRIRATLTEGSRCANVRASGTESHPDCGIRVRHYLNTWALCVLRAHFCSPHRKLAEGGSFSDKTDWDTGVRD